MIERPLSSVVRSIPSFFSPRSVPTLVAVTQAQSTDTRAKTGIRRTRRSSPAVSGAHRIRAVSRGTSRDDLGVYVHVPFCERVCPYCDFAVVGVGRLAERDEDAWLAGVLKEWERWRGEVRGRRA